MGHPVSLGSAGVRRRSPQLIFLLRSLCTYLAAIISLVDYGPRGFCKVKSALCTLMNFNMYINVVIQDCSNSSTEALIDSTTSSDFFP